MVLWVQEYAGLKPEVQELYDVKLNYPQESEELGLFRPFDYRISHSFVSTLLIAPILPMPVSRCVSSI
jgi:hypothetical protein